MTPLRYSVAMNPLAPVGSRDYPWLVLQQSTDFEGWVVIAKTDTKQKADDFRAWFEDVERNLAERMP